MVKHSVWSKYTLALLIACIAGALITVPLFSAFDTVPDQQHGGGHHGCYYPKTLDNQPDSATGNRRRCTPTPRPTDPPTHTPPPTFTPTPLPTATDVPTATDIPTDIPTATDVPTDEPTATATDEPTPTVTFTVTPEPSVFIEPFCNFGVAAFNVINGPTPITDAYYTVTDQFGNVVADGFLTLGPNETAFLEFPGFAGPLTLTILGISATTGCEPTITPSLTAVPPFWLDGFCSFGEPAYPIFIINNGENAMPAPLPYTVVDTVGNVVDSGTVQLGAFESITLEYPAYAGVVLTLNFNGLTLTLFCGVDTPTFTPTVTFTPSPTQAVTSTSTPTNTATFTSTATGTATATFTSTSTGTATLTATSSPTATYTATASATATASPTYTATRRPTRTPTATPTRKPHKPPHHGCRRHRHYGHWDHRG